MSANRNGDGEALIEDRDTGLGDESATTFPPKLVAIRD